jgi:hypothetical protein
MAYNPPSGGFSPKEEASAVGAVWSDLYADIQAAKKELMDEGYQNILTLWPAQVMLKEIEGKFGFYTLIADNQAQELKQFIANGSLECSLEAGRDKTVVVVLVILKDKARKTAVFCPLHFPTHDEQLIKEKAKDSLYVFFRILSGEIVGMARFDHFDFDSL